MNREYLKKQAGKSKFAPKHGYKKEMAEKMVSREAMVKGEKKNVKGYKDPKSGLVYPSKGAYKDKYK